MTGMTGAGALPAVPSLRSRVGRLAGDTMLRNSLAIMATSVVTSLLGYVFWLLVAHTSSAAVSGAGAAVTSALQAAALFTAVGAATAMVEWLPRSTTLPQWRRRFTVGLLVAAGGGVVGSLVAVAVLGYGLDTLPALRTPTGLLMLLLGTVFFAVGTVCDYAAVAERRGALMLARNTLFTAARVPLVLLPGLGDGQKILIAWTAAAGLSLLLSFGGFLRAAAGRTFRPVLHGFRASVREMRSSLLGQHLITVAAMLPAYLLPIIVLARTSATDNAYFYATWMLGAAFFMISPAVSTALFASAAADRSAVAAAARRSALYIAALLVVPMAVYLVGGRLLLSLFGPAYPAAGHALLVLLTISAVPDAVTNIAVAVLRATDRLRTALRLNVAMLLAGLVGSWILLPALGIVAVGVAWLGAQTAGALWTVAAWRHITRGATETAAGSAAATGVAG